jgi:periplasmic copper chaperone A
VFARKSLLAAAAGATTLALICAAPASAHVKVSGVDVTQGGYGLLTFRVPSESDTASTTEVAITFPADTPLISVDTQPKPGWTATVQTKQLATPLTDDDGDKVSQYVSEVDFKATDPTAAIPPNHFDTFNLEAGQLPNKPEISFPTLQTYSDGSTVNWNEYSADGKTEPEHPAPTLRLLPAAGVAAVSPASSSSTPAWPGWTGFGLGIAALVLSVGAVLRSGRKAA